MALKKKKKNENRKTHLGGWGIYPMLHLSPAASKTDHMTDDCSVLGLHWADSGDRQSQALCAAPPAITGAPEEALVAGSVSQRCFQVCRWISTTKKDRLSDVSQQRTLARCRLNTGNRSKEQSALLWPIGGVGPKSFGSTSPLTLQITDAIYQHFFIVCPRK